MYADAAFLTSLRLGQNRLTGVLDQLHLGILLEDENREVSFVNQAFLNMFGIGLSATEFASIPCEVSVNAAKEAFADPDAFLAGVTRRLAEKKRVTGEILELRDGRWLERHYYPIYVGQDYRGHAWIYTDVTEKIRMHRTLKRQATTDALTGLANRRRSEADLRRQLQIAHRYQRPLSVLLCDIDFFKSVNDRFGHHAGDEVLREVGSALLDLKRTADFAGRWGGEEFILILPETDLAQARVLAERLRLAIAARRMPVPGLTVTLSIGANQCSPEDDVVQALAAADQWLYAAKSGGRNRVACCLDGTVLAEKSESAGCNNR